jgi:hypothetical protein
MLAARQGVPEIARTRHGDGSVTRGGHTMKKHWEKPKLIILVRGRPEENVLAACKASIGGQNPLNDHRACVSAEGCTPCEAVGS